MNNVQFGARIFVPTELFGYARGLMVDDDSAHGQATVMSKRSPNGDRFMEVRSPDDIRATSFRFNRDVSHVDNLNTVIVNFLRANFEKFREAGGDKTFLYFARVMVPNSTVKKQALGVVGSADGQTWLRLLNFKHSDLQNAPDAAAAEIVRQVG